MSNIRTETMIYSSARSKKMREREIFLAKKIEAIAKTLDKNQASDTPKYFEYIKTKGEWEKIVKKRTTGIILRSKAQWVEDGEKNTKYFINLEKRNQDKKYIKKLIDEDGREITDHKEIIQEQKKFYEKLYTTKTGNHNIEFGDENIAIPKLETDLKELCDSPLTIEECGAALKKLQNNKSPGADGFTTNFYKFFWPDIKELLFQSYKYSERNGSLTSYQKLGILNLAPKDGKDLRYLKNWRPITLLTTDYKILTKALAMRLQKTLPSLIDPDQVGYISGRYIGQNIRIIFDLMSYTEEIDLDAYIAQIDFEKAFDSVEWPFLFQTLKKFNFGENFINWIKILYTDIQACVGNNGFFSDFFKLTRSIRQGCPISALLFLLVAEVLAINIRSDSNIKGIKIDDTELKISLMADDTTLFLADINSLLLSINKFKLFERYSGLKLNLSKTEIIPLGKTKGKNILLPPEIASIQINHGPFKALGIWYSYNQDEIIKLNIDNRIKNMNTIMNIWRSRSLSLKGKITIIKTLILPQIHFLFSMIFIPEHILQKIDKMLLDFLWNSKPAKVKRTTMIAPITDGGLGMVDVFKVHLASKISWIKRLHDPTNAKWKKVMLKMMNVNLDILNKKCDFVTSNKIPPFYSQVLKAWQQISCCAPNTPHEIVNEYILYNNKIKIGNKILDKKYINSPNLKILDVLDNNYLFLSLRQLNTTLGLDLEQMKYNSLISAIPPSWKKSIKTISDENKQNVTRLNNEPYLKINKNLMGISQCKSKQIYRTLLVGETKPPTAIDKWINTFPFLEKEDWSSIYRRTFEITKEPYLQSFQFKIINRILNNNENLKKWKIRDSGDCCVCKEVDGVEHHLYHCKDSSLFWKNLKNWMLTNLEYSFELTVCEILFGIPTNYYSDTRILNFLILIGKWYINKNKTKQTPIYFIEYLSILRDKVNTLMYIPKLEGLDVDPWLETLHDVL